MDSATAEGIAAPLRRAAGYESGEEEEWPACHDDDPAAVRMERIQILAELAGSETKLAILMKKIGHG